MPKDDFTGSISIQLAIGLLYVRAGRKELALGAEHVRDLKRYLVWRALPPARYAAVADASLHGIPAMRLLAIQGVCAGARQKRARAIGSMHC